MVFREAEIERILVVNLDMMSEVVLSIPVTRALHESYPKAKIAMLVNIQARDIVVMNPYVQDVFVYDKLGEHQGLAGFIALVNQVRSGGFQMGIAMSCKAKAAAIIWAAGIKYRIGYDRGMNKLFLTHSILPQNERIQHQTRNHLQILKPLSIETDNTSLCMVVDQTAEQLVNITIIPDNGRPVVAFCPLNKNRKNSNLSFDKILSILYELEKFANVYLIGGTKEYNDLLEVAEAAELPKERVLAGKINLQELAIFLKQIKVMVTVEACTMHMAQAFCVPVVALFGATNPAIYGPCGNRDVVLSNKISCVPCNNIGVCPHISCMNEIPLSDIIDKVAERIE